MMPCDESEHKIALYVDHELSGAKRSNWKPISLNVPGADWRMKICGLWSMPCVSRVRYMKFRNVPTLPLNASWRPRIKGYFAVTGCLWRLRPHYWSVWPSAHGFRGGRSTAAIRVFRRRAHLRYARGAFPLDVVSQEPQVVSEWPRTKTTFLRMRLPNYPTELPETERLAGYWLVIHLIGR